MPELPEAETIARDLDRRLRGRTLRRVDVIRPDVVRSGMTTVAVPEGRALRSVIRRAKRVILRLDGEIEIVFQLGMTGRITVEPRDSPMASHTHVRISFENAPDELRFRDPRRFGGVWILEPARRGDFMCTAGEHPPRPTRRTLGPLGLEPLEMRRTGFDAALQRQRQIKALLMDQTVIAGLGNIYCDESLHAAGIHPLTSSNALTTHARARLFRAIRSILRSAIRHNGSTLMDYRTPFGERGSFQKLHRVYQRDGQPCRTCRTIIQRLQVAGRSTFVCPRCQPRTRRRTG